MGHWEDLGFYPKEVGPGGPRVEEGRSPMGAHGHPLVAEGRTEVRGENGNRRTLEEKL